MKIGDFLVKPNTQDCVRSPFAHCCAAGDLPRSFREFPAPRLWIMNWQDARSPSVSRFWPLSWRRSRVTLPDFSPVADHGASADVKDQAVPSWKRQLKLYQTQAVSCNGMAKKVLPRGFILLAPYSSARFHRLLLQAHRHVEDPVRSNIPFRTGRT